MNTAAITAASVKASSQGCLGIGGVVAICYQFLTESLLCARLQTSTNPVTDEATSFNFFQVSPPHLLNRKNSNYCRSRESYTRGLTQGPAAPDAEDA